MVANVGDGTVEGGLRRRVLRAKEPIHDDRWCWELLKWMGSVEGVSEGNMAVVVVVKRMPAGWGVRCRSYAAGYHVNAQKLVR